MNGCCYFHPKQVVIGVCPLCLNERLLLLAAKQAHPSSNSSTSRGTNKISGPENATHKKPPINLHKIFAFGYLFRGLEFRHWKSHISDHEDASSPSPEDSFISIKFEENGVASWEKNRVSKISLENCNNMSWKNNHPNKQVKPKETKTVIEHGKLQRASLRWRKRIGHLFQLIRWKRSTKGSVCHVSSKAEGVKGRNKKGWIRRQAMRKAAE